MFGEFTASIIEEGSDKFISTNLVYTTKENRFLYPNYLAPINFDYKTFPRYTEWPINNNKLINYIMFMEINGYVYLHTGILIKFNKVICRAREL